MYVCMYVCMYVRTCVYTYVHRICVCVYVCMHLWTPSCDTQGQKLSSPYCSCASYCFPSILLSKYLAVRDRHPFYFHSFQIQRPYYLAISFGKARVSFQVQCCHSTDGWVSVYTTIQISNTYLCILGSTGAQSLQDRGPRRRHLSGMLPCRCRIWLYI
jgi:hypothetical protein